MDTRVRWVVGAVSLPLLVTVGIILLIAARMVGGATPATVVIGSTGLIVYIAASSAGAMLFGAIGPRRAD